MTVVPYLLNEPLVTALQQRLAGELPGVIDAINARSTNGVALDYPVQVLDHAPSPQLLSGGGFPAVGVQDLPGRFEDDIGSALTSRHQLRVISYLTDHDSGQLAWKLRRYLQAVLTVCLIGDGTAEEERRLGDGWGVLAINTVPGPTLDVPENPRLLMSWGGVTIEARRDEQ